MDIIIHFLLHAVMVFADPMGKKTANFKSYFFNVL